MRRVSHAVQARSESSLSLLKCHGTVLIVAELLECGGAAWKSLLERRGGGGGGSSARAVRDGSCGSFAARMHACLHMGLSTCNFCHPAGISKAPP